MVSGGADSTALLVLACTSALDLDDGCGVTAISRERLHVLHVNHQLRGEDATADEEFVQELAARFGIACTVASVNIRAYAQQHGNLNLEEAGRLVRYNEAQKLANRLCEQQHCPRQDARIVTAHTADDRAETFLMKALTGAATTGLASIPRRRNRIVRPLLDYTHEELCDLLQMRGISWREDKTNRDTHYLRAYVRHEVLPPLRARNPRVSQTISSTCDILADEDNYLRHLARRALGELTLESTPSHMTLDARKLCACDVALARRMVREALLSLMPEARLEAQHIERTLQLVAGQTGSFTGPSGMDIRVSAGQLRFVLPGDAPVHFSQELSVPGSLMLPDGNRLTARLLQVPKGHNAVTMARAHNLEWEGLSVLLDASACGITRAESAKLWVASPVAGEVFCPLGMHGQSKKISDYLQEERVPKTERRGVYLIHAGFRGPVLWVLGKRIDERVKCTQTTTQLLELTMISSPQLTI